MNSPFNRHLTIIWYRAARYLSVQVRHLTFRTDKRNGRLARLSVERHFLQRPLVYIAVQANIATSGSSSTANLDLDELTLRSCLNPLMSTELRAISHMSIEFNFHT